MRELCHVCPPLLVDRGGLVTPPSTVPPGRLVQVCWPGPGPLTLVFRSWPLATLAAFWVCPAWAGRSFLVVTKAFLCAGHLCEESVHVEM